MSDRRCMLNPEKWRVARWPSPNTLDEYRRTRKAFVGVWGIWPPQWDIDAPPLLNFPPGQHGHRQAFRAAFNRAQFAAVPPVRQPESFPHLTEDD